MRMVHFETEAVWPPHSVLTNIDSITGNFLLTPFVFLVTTTAISTLRGTALQARRSRVLIPDGVIRIFHWHNASGRTMALGLTQPLIEMSTSNIS
jgi:hypothetical protein